MKDLETMQREGREDWQLAKWVLEPTDPLLNWKKGWNEGGDAAITAFIQHILESGLLEEKDDLDVIVQEKLKEDRERIFKEIDWYFKTTDYKEVLVSDLQNIINSDTDVTN